MYQEFFGLRELPFELTPNPRYVFLTDRHREALSNLQYGLSSHKAVTLLIGEAGTGKTTLLQTVLSSEVCRNIRCVYVNNPALTREEFVETLARGFGLSAAAATSKATMLAELQTMLEQSRALGQSLALIVDEAQALSNALLEEVRLLANIETHSEKLLPLVLTGQPELADRLRAPELRQFRQRVSLRCEISAFDRSETAAYISNRIRIAGGHAPKIFTREAVINIYRHSRGIPRVINVLCDNVLVGAFSRGTPLVTSDIVAEVCRDFDLGLSAPDPGKGTTPGGGGPLPVTGSKPAGASFVDETRTQKSGGQHRTDASLTDPVNPDRDMSMESEHPRRSWLFR
jgi:type II secretory pathway predicted ATPase ExeA